MKTEPAFRVSMAGGLARGAMRRPAFGGVSLLALTLAAGGALTSPASAQTQWTGAVSDDWLESGAWSGRAPGPSDVTVNGLSRPPVIAGGGQAEAGDLHVGDSGPGALTIEDGALSAYLVNIGVDGGNGAVTVTGPNATLDSAVGIYVGRTGSGALDIRNGAAVASLQGVVGADPGSFGTVTVDGANWTTTIASAGVLIGFEGEGHFTVSGGGLVNTHATYLGYYTGSSGTLTITGPGSSWLDGADMYVGGLGGHGTLDVRDGGYLQVSNTPSQDHRPAGIMLVIAAVLLAGHAFRRGLLVVQKSRPRPPAGSGHPKASSRPGPSEALAARPYAGAELAYRPSRVGVPTGRHSPHERRLFNSIDGFNRVLTISSGGRLRPDRRGLGRTVSAPISSMKIRALLAGSAYGALLVGLASMPASADPVALPGGGAVIAGGAAIAYSPGALTVSQSSDNAILEWNDFSIGAGGSVFFQNGAGATLNRVTGGAVSTIDGRLGASGSVYLINPNGLVVGSEGIIDVGGRFVASTLNLSDTDFLAGGDLRFAGTSDALVVNFGKIGSLGGDIALIAARVENHGAIEAPNGAAGLAAGYRVLLRDNASTDGQFAIELGGNSVLNAGAIRAAAAELRANGGNIYALAGNNGGEIRATGVSQSDGRVFLVAEGGAVEIDSTVAALSATGAGGTIVASGETVRLGAQAALDASGGAGGLVLVGGHFQGGAGDPNDPLYRDFVGRFGALPEVVSARFVTVEAGAVIDVSATGGDGGTAIVWSDDITRFAGRVAGGSAGNGGFAEVSGKEFLDFTGAADLRGVAGAAGTLLLDPFNLEIRTTAGSPAAGASGSPTNAFTANANNSILQISTLTSALANSNVVVSTGSSGSQAGTILVSNAITWSAGTTLTLNAAGAITINAGITNTNASSGLTLTSAGAEVYLLSGAINVGTLNINAATFISSATGTINNANGIANLTVNPGDSGLDYAINLSGTVTSGTLTLNAPKKVFPFRIVAGNLRLLGAGPFELTTTNNQIGTLAANTTGRINIYNSVTDLNIGSVGGTNGVIAGALNLQIASGRTVNQSQPISVSSLTLRNNTMNQAATYNLTNTGNSIGAFAATLGTAGVAQVYGAGGLAIASVLYDEFNLLTGVSSASRLTLSNTGTVTQSARISATNLELLGAGGNYVLTHGSNVFATLAANTGSINVARNSMAALAVGTAGGTTGVTTTGAAVISAANAGNSGLAVNAAINSGGGVQLNSVGGIAINANVTATGNSSIWLRPDTGGNGALARAVVFNGGARAITGGSGVTSIYSNVTSFTAPPNYLANVTGTLRSYMYVSTLSQLQDMSSNLSGSYALNRDIDATPTAGWNGGAGFNPIGGGGASFTGNFDGLGRTIGGLVINRPGSNFVGLFGSTFGANIANLSLVGGSITGGVATGAVVGTQFGGRVSGLVSSVSVTGSLDVGGLVGFADGTIERSYSTGAVTGQDGVGGLAGYLSGTLSQSYATGAVTGARAGGLVGELETSWATVSSSFWDVQTTGQSGAFGSGSVAGATGLTSAQFTNTGSFAGWTFGTTAGGPGWVIVNVDSTLNNAGGAAGATRPMLLSEASTSGVIGNGHQLQLMALNLGGSYSLSGNIDMSETSRASGVWLNAGFVPIGSAVLNGAPSEDQSSIAFSAWRPFTGTFDGGGRTISNLYINRPATDFVGLFGYVTQATIRNVALAGGSVTGRDYTGGLIGEADWIDAAGVSGRQSDLQVVSAGLTVSGRDYVGGLIGYMNQVLINNGAIGQLSSASGNVSGRNFVGGLAGYDKGDQFSPAYNVFATGNVTATGNYAGGLMGYALTGGLMSDPGFAIYATGSVSGADHVGGLIGWNAGSVGGVGTLTYATGAVLGVNNVGGLVGYNASQVQNAFATGEVTGVQNVGGLVGNNDGTANSGFIDLSFATGIVRGVTNVGGLAGLNTNLIGAINNTGGAYATGAVYGTTNVGGLVGSNIGDAITTFGRINSSYAIGYVSGTTNVGGLVGNSAASGTGIYRGYVLNSYFNTDTSGRSNALGAGTTGTNGIALASMPKTTAQLQQALQAGFATAAWGIVANTSLPWFKWLYGAGTNANNTPQVVSGIAYSDRGTTPLAGAAASLLVSGLSGAAASVAASAVGSTGANGYYYFLVPANTFTVGSPKQVLAYTAGASGGATLQERATASVTGQSIYGTYLRQQATAPSTALSTVNANLALAVNNNAAAQARLGSLANLEINPVAANFSIDQAINTGTLMLTSTGAVTQSAAINASNLLLLGAGGAYTLTNSGNSIGVLAANTGTVNLARAGSLAIGSVNGVAGVTATGAITLTGGGNLTINAAARILAGTNNNVVLAADGNFINNRGADAIGVSGSGRWLVYSSAPGTNVFGGLDSGATAYWNASYATLPPGSAPAGNRYIFAQPATLTITTTDTSKTYGDDASADVATRYSISGYQSGVAGAFLGDSASSVFSGSISVTSTGSAATASVAGGPYSIVATGPLTALNGYTFDFQNSGMLTVDRAALTITAADAAKTYGDALTFAGTEFSVGAGQLRNSDIVDLVTLASAGADASAAVGSGSYAIGASAATGANFDTANYDISYVDGRLTVNRAALTITASDAAKTYGDAVTFAGTEFSVGAGQLKNGDIVDLVTLASAGADASAAVGSGSYAIGANAASGASFDRGNYDISYIDGALTIGRAGLAVTALDASKVYDGLAFTGGNGLSYLGLVNGEDESALGGSLVYGGSAQGAINAGSYVLTASGLASGNYDISYIDGALDVDRASLSVTANAAAKTYDGLAFTGGNGVSYAGFVTGEDESVLGGALVYGGSAQGATNASVYDIAVSGLTSGNYDISYADGALTIGRAALAVTALDASKIYDGLAFAGGNGVSYAGFVTGEDESALGGTLAYGGAAQGAIGAGVYDIVASGLTSGNYDIIYRDGALTIGRAALTVTALDASKIYDGLAFAGGNGVSYAGFVTGEDESALGGALAYGGPAQGAVNAGAYGLTSSGLTSGNYDISYVNGVLTVARAALTVTANNAAKTYDGLAFAGGNGVSYAGFVTGEGASVLGGALAYGGAAQGATNAGSYSLTASGLTSGNYDITYNAGALTIDRAALSVAANNASKTYDGLAFTGGNGVSYTGFVNGEGAAVLGGALAYGGAAQGATNAGSYALAASGLASANYDISYVNGVLTVDRVALAVTANNASRIYDGLAFTGGNGVAYAGFVTGEDESALGGALVYGGAAQGARNAGSYSLTVSGLTSGNYDIAYNAGALTVSPAALAVRADDVSKTAGAADPLFTYSITSGQLFAGDQFTGALRRAEGEAIGAYAIGQGDLAASANYALTFVDGELTITAVQAPPRTVYVGRPGNDAGAPGPGDFGGAPNADDLDDTGPTGAVGDDDDACADPASEACVNNVHPDNMNVSPSITFVGL